MIAYMKISNIVFELVLDNNIFDYFSMRVHNLDYTSCTPSDIKIICKKQSNLLFSNTKFMHQQEPDINDLFIYREIFDLGIFKYCRNTKTLNTSYINSAKYPYNSFEVVVDTLLQFIYLIMLDFNITPLHASVVAYKQNAVLLFGNSGSGKTTLELSMLKNGFRFFSDDIAFMNNDTAIYNSHENILACSSKTIDIASSALDSDLYYTMLDSVTNKYILPVPQNIICHHSPLKPTVLIFLNRTGIPSSQESFNKISAKNALLNLIQLSISKQFSAHQKKLYLCYLKKLSECAIAFQYTHPDTPPKLLNSICSSIKDWFVNNEVICHD